MPRCAMRHVRFWPGGLGRVRPDDKQIAVLSGMGDIMELNCNGIEES